METEKKETIDDISVFNREFLYLVRDRIEDIKFIMRRDGIVFDGTGGNWQSFSFMLYTIIAEDSDVAFQILQRRIEKNKGVMMETEKEMEVRKDSFLKWRDDMRNSRLFQGSNRIGKNLSYSAYMSSWNHGRRALLKEIIDEMENQGLVMNSIYHKFDCVNEEIINHEKI